MCLSFDTSPFTSNLHKTTNYYIISFQIVNLTLSRKDVEIVSPK